MATLYIQEFVNGVSTIGTTKPNNPPQPANAVQAVSIGSSTATSAAFGANTNFVEIVSDTDCFFLFGGASVAATTSDMYLPAKTYRSYGVQPGGYIAAIT